MATPFAQEQPGEQDGGRTDAPRRSLSLGDGSNRGSGSRRYNSAYPEPAPAPSRSRNPSVHHSHSVHGASNFSAATGSRRLPDLYSASQHRRTKEEEALQHMTVLNPLEDHFHMEELPPTSLYAAQPSYPRPPSARGGRSSHHLKEAGGGMQQPLLDRSQHGSHHASHHTRAPSAGQSNHRQLFSPSKHSYLGQDGSVRHANGVLHIQEDPTQNSLELEGAEVLDLTEVVTHDMNGGARTASGSRQPAVAIEAVVRPPTVDWRLMQRQARTPGEWLHAYFHKWLGIGTEGPPPLDHWEDIFFAFLGSFISILAIAVINNYVSPEINLPLLVASFGASAVLLFGVPEGKLSQPRAFLGGQVVSAFLGVCVRNMFPDSLNWVSAALGMAGALALMMALKLTHPPGGATALIAASAEHIGPWRGFKFLLTIMWACAIMLAVALVVNNISTRRRYPSYWF